MLSSKYQTVDIDSLTRQRHSIGQVDHSDIVTDKCGRPVRVHGNDTGVTSGATREKSGGAKDNGDPPDLVDAIVPAVGSSDYTAGADQGTSAHTRAIEADDGEKKTSLEGEYI